MTEEILNPGKAAAESTPDLRFDDPPAREIRVSRLQILRPLWRTRPRIPRPIPAWRLGSSAEGRVAIGVSTRGLASANYSPDDIVPFRETETPANVDDKPAGRAIHILGTGSVGKLVAHSLRGLPNPPEVTLLLHKGSLYTQWEQGPKEITLTTKGASIAHGGFQAEMARPGWRLHGRQVHMKEALEQVEEYDLLPRERQGPGYEDVQVPDFANKGRINMLIVTVKACNTVTALLSIKHRLNRDTAILFLQNGMGIVDEVNEKVFPDETSRPAYLQGVISHGVTSNSPWSATHTGQGLISISPLSKLALRRNSRTSSDLRDAGASNTRSLLTTVCSSPALAAISISPSELLKTQLDKLAVNCVINPLTALCDARNSCLLRNKALERTARLLLAEISLVIRNLPELASIPNIDTRFGVSHLFKSYTEVVRRTQDNLSSMLVDVRAGRRTEIDYINGYIVKRGEELGIKCFMNYMMQQTVNGKRMVVRRELLSELPVAREKKADPFLANMGQSEEDEEDEYQS